MIDHIKSLWRIDENGICGLAFIKGCEHIICEFQKGFSSGKVTNKYLIYFMLWPITDMMADTGNPYYCVCSIYAIPIIQSKTIKQLSRVY